ncbi:MAG TPA: TolC family protein [Candidatus Latescibacteria bacterium]|nr:TolC family protein [Candidatus Latescibacterota bacterium]
MPRPISMRKFILPRTEGRKFWLFSVVKCKLNYALVLLAGLICWVPGNAQESAKRWTLSELIASAEEHNSDIERWRWKVESANASRRKANAVKILPRLRINSESGLVPEAKGDIFNPPQDLSGIRPLGPFNRTELEFAQPLFPLSQGRSLNKAAAEGVDVERADLAQAHLDVVFAIKELYYGLLLAQDLKNLARRLNNELTEKKEAIDDADGLSLTNRYKLELTLLEMAKRAREINDKVELARAALTWKAGLPDETVLQVQAEWLAPVTPAVLPLDELSTRAIGLRPDARKLQAGLAATQALTQVARAAYLPQVFVGGGIRYAITPGRTDQRNPFVKDNFNYFNGGIFIGIRQSLEWRLIAADVDKAKAEYRELKAREAGAAQGIRLDVRRAYLNYQRADQDLQGARQGRQLARQWLQEARDEYDFDPGAIGDLVTAFETWAHLEQGYSQAIYDYNLSIAKLEKITGGLKLSVDDEISQ